MANQGEEMQGPGGVPSLRLGAAARSLLYPCLSANPAARSGANFSRSGARDSPRILWIEARPKPEHRRRLLTAQAQEARTVLVPWSMNEADALGLVDGLDGRYVRVARPAFWLDPRLDPYAFPLPLQPIQSARDRIARSWLELPAPRTTAPRTIRSALMCCVGRLDDLDALAPALRRAPLKGPLLVVSPQPAAAVSVRLATLELSAIVLDEAEPEWLDALRDCRAIVASAPSQPLAAAIWTLTGLRAGAPVITDPNPLLEEVASSTVAGDWERGLAIYLGDSAFRTIDAAVGQATVISRFSASGAATTWESAIREWREAAPSPPRSGPPLPVLMVLLDLPQDLDVCLPILLAVRRQARLALRVVVTDWLREEAPRTFDILRENGFEPEVVRRKHAISGLQPTFKGVQAFLAPSATSQSPHRAGYGLTKIANAQGVMTFTLQHGFENVGLTYREDGAQTEVQFASRHIFTWLAKENLPDWIVVGTFARAIGAGNPKATPAPTWPSNMGLPPRRWSYRVGVFENLHWARYDEAYISRFLDELTGAAQARPDVLFVIKPHSAGRWAVKNLHRLPQLANVFCIDPLAPAWSRFTAPELIGQLDGVITTPSTVAVDAAHAARPAAVIGDARLSLGIYEPLPLLRAVQDWLGFIDGLGERRRFLELNERFLRRNFLPQLGQWRIAELISELCGDHQLDREGVA